jgi:inosose dehydratase
MDRNARCRPARPVHERLAGAPISWGVCEVPEWGLQLPPTRVLGDMTGLGLRACELGPSGYLGDEPAAVGRLLASHGLRAVGGFVPLVLHDPGVRGETRRAATRAAALLGQLGAACFVTAAVADPAWSRPTKLAERAWAHLLDGLAMVEEICVAHSLRQVLHPHVGTQIETAADVQHVLAGSPVLFCLDTGHLTLGGVDVAAFAADHADRVGHVHLKDVRLSVAVRLRRGERSLAEATRDGLFCALGRGDVPVAAVVGALESAGYDGWYVLEQDLAIDTGTPPESVHPENDVALSMAFLDERFAVGAAEAGGAP